ncbi:type IA DNA topoisomerase [Lactococcus formosensis subsp. bovis]|uniref:type IA DNA topoisomerase n=1 Tax=Lactococcus formosensis TaxID=1281486 RepID=UPI001BD155EC|nr:DNA topoisomerase [Lactococcus formosensis]
MPKRLIIAEKREQAEGYAKALGRPKKVGDSYVVSDELHIAYCAGHLFGIVNDALESYKNVESLPLFPKFNDYEFDYSPTQETSLLKLKERLFKNIKKEVSWCDEIVIGTDGDREGESIFYTMINKIPGAQSKIKYRLWVGTATKAGIKKAYENLKFPEETYGFFLAADARRKADWLIGVANLTPFMRHKLKELGQLSEKKVKGKKVFEKISVGRVLLPIMKIILEREREIRNHHPQKYWKIELTDEFQTNFTSDLIFGGEENSLGIEDAKSVFQSLEKETQVSSIIQKEETVKAPPLFNLTNLQTYMSKNHGLSSDETQKTAEGLRLREGGEDGYLSYPRTDSVHISQDEFLYLKAKLNDFKNLIDINFEAVNLKPRKKYVNDTKTNPHYALIPTETLPDLNKLSAIERTVYEQVVKRMLLMFAPDQKVAKTTIKLNLLDQTIEFKAIGTQILEEGWAQLEGKTTSDKVLPSYKEGQVIQITPELKEDITKPPKLHNEETLLKRMKKYYIGTSSTRADAIKRLKKEKYLSVNKKGQFETTEKSRKIIEYLEKIDSKFLDLEMTGNWELVLKLIEEGSHEFTPQDFLEQVQQEIRQTLKG